MAVVIRTGGSRYGPLQENFEFVVPENYSVLVGPNNSGKSGILQQAFRVGCDEGGLGPGGVCLILPDRTQLLPSTETAGRSLEGFNQELVQHMRGTLLSYEQYTGPQRGELARVLLNHTDFESQLAELQVLLARLGFSRLFLRTSQSIHFDDVAGPFQGSGLRALLPVLCALTDESLKLILIDEPEEALEPRLQKALRDLLIEKAEGRSVMVSTHSHLFLNRREASSNIRVRRAAGIRLQHTRLSKPWRSLAPRARLQATKACAPPWPGRGSEGAVHRILRAGRPPALRDGGQPESRAFMPFAGRMSAACQPSVAGARSEEKSRTSSAREWMLSLR